MSVRIEHDTFGEIEVPAINTGVHKQKEVNETFLLAKNKCQLKLFMDLLN